MREEHFGPATVVVTIVVLTLLFDLVDLRPQVRSFGFVRTGTYWVYYLVRLVIALGAAVLIAAGQADRTQPAVATGLAAPAIQAVMIGFAAVLGGVVLLQGFALNIGGTDVVSPARLIQLYKEAMVDQETGRHEQARRAGILDAIRQLIVKIEDEAELRRLCVIVLLQTYGVHAGAIQAQEAVEKATAFLKILDEAYVDPDLRRRIYAIVIAESNPIYTRGLLDQLASVTRSA